MARTFDIEIERKISKDLDWPDARRLESDSGLGGNRDYADMRGFTWHDYREAVSYEVDLVGRLDQLEDDDARCELLEALEEDDDVDAEIHALMGLDPGVASAVIALSAAGCAPFVSCNGGAFGDRHYEDHPLIGFFCHQPLAPLVLEAATEADVGLEEHIGGLLVYSRTIGAMMAFGSALHQRREQFLAVGTESRLDVGQLSRPDEADDQLDLFGL